MKRVFHTASSCGQYRNATPNVTAWPDVPLALSQGTFDGLSSTDESLASAKLWESGVKYGFEDHEFVGFYVPMMRHLHPEDHPKREKDLEHFLTIAARYRSLGSLLSDMALEPPTDSVGDVLAAGDEQEGLLTLSTIHSAKGLEWEAVFVIWLVDGRFPSYHNLHDTEEMEEERRLLYVSVTRAKRHLHLSYPIDVYDRTTGMVLGKPSRFLDGLPGHILSETQVIEEGGLR